VDSPETLLRAREHDTAQPTVARQRIARNRHTPRVQELVLGRYRLLAQLGSGGFGVVWRAHDELLHREVAVKRVWLGADGGPIDAERASREALATARLAHPAIVALYEACAQDGAFYLISELVDGETLACLIADDELGDEQVLEIGVALASALAHAHERGVIHRDIKPQNVLVPQARGEQRQPAGLQAAAKLTDFGGATLVGEDALTRTGDVLGTLAYMAPEQSEGREVGVQADLYSLALVIYEALCGVNPVRAATPAATVRRIGSRLPSLARVRGDLPRELTRALDRALAPAPADRGTLEELRGALEDALQHDQPRTLRARRASARAARWSQQQRPALQPHAPVAEPPPPAPTGDPAGGEAELQAREHLRPTRLPRATWLACAALLAGWQASAGRAGVALLVIAALAPLFALSGRYGASRLGPRWLACGLAPALGLVGLAGAFPAIAGQASRWRERAALGVLAYWWLRLAEPLLDSGAAGRRLWLGPPAGTPPRAAWEGSLSLAASHVVGPLLTVGVLLGALLWGAGALALPWIVRGRSAALDLVAVTVWSALLVAGAPALDGGLKAHAPDPSPHGIVLGAVLGGMLAVAARALRGPV